MASFDKVRLNSLTIKYLLGVLTEAESRELHSMLDRDPVLRTRFERRVDRDRLKRDLETYLDIEKRLVIPGQPVRVYGMRRYLPYAAAILLMLGGLSIWLWKRPAGKKAAPDDPIISMQYEVQPGTHRATLILGNGAAIDLDAAGKGVVSRQGAVDVVKTGDGRLSYTAAATGVGAAQLWNAVTTPRGGTYQVTLPDGSQAWLNAASSIRFPTTYGAGRREAQITGEVYFAIAHDPARPFYVSGGTATVQVLGTEFDIKNYPNESAVRVTLVNGSVKVEAGNQHAALSPGQQAELTPEKSLTLIEHPDIDQATAWKSGYFKFKHADIRSIMREVERWYDVDVVYEISDYSMTYGGRISRGLPLSRLLRLLQGNNIHHYKMEGRKLVVLP